MPTWIILAAQIFEGGQSLYNVLLQQRFVTNEENRNKQQVSFLENHHYFTATAIAQRKVQKERNRSVL